MVRDWHAGLPPVSAQGGYIPDEFDVGTSPREAVESGEWKFLHIGNRLYVLTYDTANIFGTSTNYHNCIDCDGDYDENLPSSPYTSPYFPIEAVMIGLSYKTLESRGV